MTQTNPLSTILDSRALMLLQNAPMPAYSGYEPNELALKRIEIRMKQGRFTDLPLIEQKWVCGRLIPSLVRYGCYPPPDAANPIGLQIQDTSLLGKPANQTHLEV